MTIRKDTWNEVERSRAALEAEDATQLASAPGSVAKNAAALSGMRGRVQAFIGDVITRRASTILAEADAEAQRIIGERDALERAARLKRFEAESTHVNPGAGI